MDVMRLIDLVADLDTPSAPELRAFADRALVQVETASLRIGIATDSGRPIADILALVDALGVKRDVWSLSSIDRPTGVDAWIIVIGSEPDLTSEKRFLERIGDVEEAIVVTGPDLGAASELGVSSDRIFGADLGGLKELVERWQSERDAIRSRVLAAHARPVLESLARDQSSLEERLRNLPDAAAAATARDAFDQRSRLALDAFRTSGGQVIDEMREEVVRCFSDWVDTITANHGDRPSRDRVQESLEKWLRDRFVKSFSDRVSRRVSTHAEQLPLLRGALAAMEKSQAADFWAPAVNVPDRAEPSALRWLFPIAGGGVGFWRGGVKLGLIGAALGLVIARVMRKRAKKPLRDKALKAAAANHLATHLEAVLARSIDSLSADCALELERLKQAALAAERTAPERDRINATLEQIAKARALLTA